MSNRRKLSRVQKRKAQLAKREKEQKKHQQRQEAKGKEIAVIGEAFRNRLAAMWSPDKIKPMATDAIIRKLGELGIDFDEHVFRSKAPDFYSPSDLSEHLWRDQVDLIDGVDADFPWMAAEELWNRLCPGIVSRYMIDEGIDAGYKLVDQDKLAAACDRWLQVWNDLKSRFLVGTKTVATVNERGSDYYIIHKWLLSVDRELSNASSEDSAYFQKRIAFCTEILELLPESPSEFLEQMGYGIAESHFMLGEAQAGDKAFQHLISKFPAMRWVTYASWGDLWTGNYRSKVPSNLNKARELYEKALDLAPPEEVEKIHERLEELMSDSP